MKSIYRYTGFLLLTGALQTGCGENDLSPNISGTPKGQDMRQPVVSPPVTRTTETPKPQSVRPSSSAADRQKKNAGKNSGRTGNAQQDSGRNAVRSGGGSTTCRRPQTCSPASLRKSRTRGVGPQSDGGASSAGGSTGRRSVPSGYSAPQRRQSPTVSSRKIPSGENSNGRQETRLRTPTVEERKAWKEITNALKDLLVARSVTFAEPDAESSSLRKEDTNQYHARGKCVTIDQDGTRKVFFFDCRAVVTPYEAQLLKADFADAADHPER